MRPQTARQVDAWWVRVFGVTDADLWQRVTAHRHGLLADYPGWYVAWKGSGVHVSAPPSADAADVESLRAATGTELRGSTFWLAFARQRGLVLLGPSVHHVLDVDPGPDHEVVAVSREDVASLRGVVTDAEWVESGVEHCERWFGLHSAGALVAVAGLDDWDGAPRDVSVLVAPAARGRGLATRVGGHAASYAVREHGLARWRALTTNQGSTRAAERLGFEPYCHQLAARPA